MVQGFEHREMIWELARRYGTDFLDFVCAYDGADTILDWVPTDAQREVIADLHQRSQVLAEIPDFHARRIATARDLCGYVEELGSTRPMVWHRSCGGHAPQINDDGTVEALLRVLAGDFLGFRLLDDRTHINAVLEKHPAYHEIFERFADDEPLARMFVDAARRRPGFDETQPEWVTRLVTLCPLWSDGTHRTLSFPDLLGVLLTNPRVKKYVPNDIVVQVQDAAVADLGLARALSSGERVMVPTYVGLTGVKLADDVDLIGLRGIRLRRSTPLDPGCLDGTTRVWTIAEVDTEVWHLHNNVQESHTHDDFPVIEPMQPEHREIVQAHHKGQADAVERLRFALLLSSETNAALATKAAFITTANPLLGAYAQLAGNLAHNASAVTLTDPVAQQLNIWLPALAKMPDQLVLPMRRLLRAAAERNDVIDGLIDSVIAWEALFGANPEIKFQVTGAMAVLLEGGDMVRRAALKDELGKIYDMRSKFVHGSGDIGDKKLSADTVTDRAARALTLGIAAFREVLKREDLLKIAESRLRSQKILLGF